MTSCADRAIHRTGVPGPTAGFTLVELMAALGILLVGVVALIGALSSSVASRRTADARLAAASYCEEAILRIREEAVRRAAGGESDFDLELGQLPNQTVPGFDGMTWSAEVREDESRPDIWLVRLEIRWLEEGEDASEVFWRILPRSLPLGRRVRRFRDGLDGTASR